MNFLEPLLDLVKDFTVKRAFSFIFLLVLLLGTAWGLELYTGYWHLNRLEKATVLIERISTLDKAGYQDPSLQETRDVVVRDLKQTISPDPSIAVRPSIKPREWLYRNGVKFVCGGLPWFLISLSTLRAVLTKKKDAWYAFFAIQIFTIFFGFVAIAVPDFSVWWIDYVAVPWGIFLFVVVIPTSIAAVAALGKVRENSQRVAITNNLRQIASAAAQFSLDKGTAAKDLSELIAHQYLKGITPIAGESYDALDLHQNQVLTVRTKDGRIFSFPS
jgi:hypothetical protein